MKSNDDFIEAFEEACRSPHGERGLKSNDDFIEAFEEACRSPHGERGLKFSQKVSMNEETFVALLMESVD